jgi:uncharacterized protein YcfL
MKLLSTLGLLTALLLSLTTGCSSRVETAVTAADSTVVYPSKKAGGIEAKITFYRKESKKTGKRIGEGQRFALKQKRKLRALVELQNHGNQEVMLHLEWIGPKQKTFLSKQLQLLPGDTAAIQSSISISPAKRKAGKYKLRVYLFRELIAEKEFELLPEFWFNDDIAEKTKARITFYRKMSKKTPGKRIGEDSVFIIWKKRKLRAVVDLQKPSALSGHELQFKLKWTGPDGNTFFQKKLVLPAGDTTTALHSSISISPEKRTAGKYSLRVFFFQKLIAQKEFELLQKSPEKH